MAEEGQRRREIRSDVDCAELSTLIVGTLEGTLMMSRLNRNDAPLDLACRHLEEYLETRIRTKPQKAEAKKS
jgi:hypothetical protein